LWLLTDRHECHRQDKSGLLTEAEPQPDQCVTVSIRARSSVTWLSVTRTNVPGPSGVVILSPSILNGIGGAFIPSPIS
jgi:hypothetical protein